jgi:site-specific DNA-methyltransferase (cytosine-N4-specific)
MEHWRSLRGKWTVRRATADDDAAYGGLTDRRRLILTSPPYATALPYIDTDRLSVVALGLADAKELLALERDLIGSREWTRTEQVLWDERRSANADDLPPTVTNLLRDIHDRNADGSAGFRRRAVPSLLYRYFARMGESFGAWSRTLRAGESAVVIVGHNRTTAGGERVDIATPELLGHVAERRGFNISELIKLETWPRYGLHSANGVAGEDALVVTRPTRR